MRCKLHVLLCLLAGGCTTGPPVFRPIAETVPSVATAVLLPVPPSTSVLRLGVEYLPPDADSLTEVSEVPLAEPVVHLWGTDDGSPTSAPSPTTFRAGSERPRHLWSMRSEDLAADPEPVERYVLQFIDDVVGEDRRRIKRELGMPILTRHYESPSDAGLTTHIDEQLAEEEFEAIGERGPHLLQRPLRRLLRRLPMVESVELELESFKADNVPLTQAYHEQHPERRGLGRMSMRLRVNDLDDPVEVAFVRHGVRVGSGLENLRLGMVRWLDDDLAVEVHSRCNYDSGAWTVRADLVWYANEHTSIRIVAGDHLDFTNTSGVYSLFESPMDGSPGVMIAAVHLF